MKFLAKNEKKNHKVIAWRLSYKIIYMSFLVAIYARRACKKLERSELNCRVIYMYYRDDDAWFHLDFRSFSMAELDERVSRSAYENNCVERLHQISFIVVPCADKGYAIDELALFFFSDSMMTSPEMLPPQRDTSNPTIHPIFLFT